MNPNLEDALKAGHQSFTALGVNPVVVVSSLLELLAFNDLKEEDGEADFFINGDLITQEKEAEIRRAPLFHDWKEYNVYPNQKTILYFYSDKQVRITAIPYYTRGDNTYVNIINDQFFVWPRIHFDSFQTKTFKGTQYTIPYDPIGFLETYYGKPWDDFDGRKGWNWRKALNLQKLSSLP